MGMEEEKLEGLAKKIKAKDLREEAKKRGIKTACVKKIDIAKQLPKEVLEELGSKQ
jgi:BioD-like phosphotransacetylase family protein